jgi:predicted RNase H-like HicB family nuclease
MMQIPVLVEPVADHNFRAKSGEPLPVSAEGATPEEALRNLRAAMDRQLKNGKQLRSLEMASENPWLALAGSHDANDPLIQQWKREMAAYRQEVEDDPDRP